MWGKRSSRFIFSVCKYWETKEFEFGFNICKDVWDDAREDCGYYVSIAFGLVGFVIGYEVVK